MVENAEETHTNTRGTCTVVGAQNQSRNPETERGQCCPLPICAIFNYTAIENMSVVQTHNRKGDDYLV